jgi:hypothetical protein
LQPSLLPQSSLGKAVRYLLNEYAALTGYLDDGDYLIDNNLVENVIPSSGLRSLCRDARNAEQSRRMVPTNSPGMDPRRPKLGIIGVIGEQSEAVPNFVGEAKGPIFLAV